jgi:PTS system nitrogen regulatory IIA component
LLTLAPFGEVPMEISDLLSAEGVVANLRATSKKQALQEMARRAAGITGLHERAIFDVLMERERLGTTGVGNGIAIPHGKLANLDKLHGLFARLEQPIDFDSIDEQPVDLIFLLLAPESAGADHLKALARVSRLLRDRGVCAKLRGTDDSEALYALLTDAAATRAA